MILAAAMVQANGFGSSKGDRCQWEMAVGQPNGVIVEGMADSGALVQAPMRELPGTSTDITPIYGARL